MYLWRFVYQQRWLFFLYQERFTYWDNKFFFRFWGKRLAKRRKEHYNGDRWTKHKDKQDERVIFRAFLPIFLFPNFFFVVFCTSPRVLFHSYTTFFSVILVRNKFTNRRKACVCICYSGITPSCWYVLTTKNNRIISNAYTMKISSI